MFIEFFWKNGCCSALLASTSSWFLYETPLQIRRSFPYFLRNIVFPLHFVSASFLAEDAAQDQ
jgi:hypothetical protein